MTMGRDLLALFASAENLPALRRVYFTVIRLITAELARAPYRPSPGRTGEVIRRIREIAQRINPRATSPVRKWIDREVVAAFMLGDHAASGSIEQARGSVIAGFSDENRVALNSLRGQVASKLQSVYLQILQTAEYVVRRVQMVMGTAQKTTGGIIRGQEGRALAADVAAVIERGDTSPERKRRLIAAGFAQDFPLLSGLSSGYFMSGLKIRMSVEDYVGLVGEGLSRQGANKAVEIRAKQNGINYVRVNRSPQLKDVCALFIGQVYHTTQGVEDPLGFPSVVMMPGGGQLPQHPRCGHWFEPWDPAAEGPAAVTRLKALSDLIPRRFLGMQAAEASKAVREMSPEELFAIAPMAFGDGAESRHPIVKGLAA